MKEIGMLNGAIDFTAWGNVMLVSGAGKRWKLEK